MLDTETTGWQTCSVNAQSVLWSGLVALILSWQQSVVIERFIFLTSLSSGFVIRDDRKIRFFPDVGRLQHDVILCDNVQWTRLTSTNTAYSCSKKTHSSPRTASSRFLLILLWSLIIIRKPILIDKASVDRQTSNAMINRTSFRDWNFSAQALVVGRKALVKPFIILKYLSD